MPDQVATIEKVFLLQNCELFSAAERRSFSVWRVLPGRRSLAQALPFFPLVNLQILFISW